MYLQQKKPTDLDAREAKLLELVKKQSIEYFPTGKALQLPQSDSSEEVADKVNSTHP
jgi:hypothetical protein